MRLSNMFEQDTPQAAAMGANAIKKTIGTNTSGAMISKALDKLDQGDTLSGPLAKTLSPYADALKKILSNPVYRNKFMQIMKQIRDDDNKARSQTASVSEAEDDVVDTVSMDVPLLLRMLEYAREDAQEDMDLHNVAERMIAISKDGSLSMEDYDSIVGDVDTLPSPEETPVEESYYTPGPETMPGAVGPQETTTVTFNQSKQIGDATLNINASAKDMEELHRILKLAGIDYASDGAKHEPVVVPDPPVDAPCGGDDKPQDVKYTTDKQTLINVLRDKLQKRLA